MRLEFSGAWTPTRVIGLLCILGALTLSILLSQEPSPNVAGLKADPSGAHLWSILYDDQQKRLARMESEEWGLTIIGCLFVWAPRIRRRAPRNS